MKDNINIEEVTRLLTIINETVQTAHPDVDDETGAIVWNCCLTIAEELGVTLP